MKKLCWLILPAFLLSGFHVPAQDRYPNTLLWEISGKNPDHTSYLFGTFHTNQKEAFNFNDSVLPKLVSVDAFANEFDLDSVSDNLDKFIAEKENEKKLSELLSEAELKKVDSFLRKKKNISLKELNDPTAREFYLKFSTLNFNKGEMKTFLDAWLYNTARNYGKKIFGLEGINDSFEKISNEPDKDQHDMIMTLVDSGDATEKIEQKMKEVYLREDLNAIADLIGSKGSKYTSEILLAERNQNMTKKIMEEMEIQSCFFAVGAAHLIGDEGLITRLTKEGFRVTPIIAAKSGYYKKFVKEDASDGWEAFVDKENGYSVEMPGKPGIFNSAGLEMHGYVEMGTGKMYMCAALPSAKAFLDRNDKELIKYLETNFGKKGTTSNEHSLTFKGCKGVEMDVLSEAAKLRVRLVLNNSAAYIFIEGEQASSGKAEFSEKFFNSVNFFTPPEVAYSNFSSDTGAFSIRAPGDFKQSGSIDKEGLRQRTYSAKDKKKSISLTVAYTDYSYGRYLKDLDYMYSLCTDALQKSLDTILDVTTTDFCGLPARQILLSSSSSYGKIIYVIRDNRLYSLAIQCDQPEFFSKVDELTDSFRFTPYLNAEFKKYNSTEGDFSILFPSMIRSHKITDSKEEEVQDSMTRYYYGYDPATSMTYNVIKEKLERYYFANEEDSTYFRKIIGRLYPDDSIMDYSFFRNHDAIGMNCKVLFNKNTKLAAHERLELNGNDLYTVACFTPSSAYGDSLGTVFLNSFQILKRNGPSGIFSSRLKLLLDDLRLGTSADIDLIKDQFSSYPVNAVDTIVLLKALAEKYADDSEATEGIRFIIYRKLFRLFNDSSVSSKYVYGNYRIMGNNPNIQILALIQLARCPGEENYRMLKDILLKDKPHGSSVDDSYPLFFNLSAPENSFSKSLYPEIMQLTSDDYYRNSVYRTTRELMEDSLLGKEDIALDKNNLMTQALKELETLQADTISPHENYSAELENLLFII